MPENFSLPAIPGALRRQHAASQEGDAAVEFLGVLRELSCLQEDLLEYLESTRATIAAGAMILPVPPDACRRNSENEVPRVLAERLEVLSRRNRSPAGCARPPSASWVQQADVCRTSAARHPARQRPAGSAAWSVGETRTVPASLAVGRQQHAVEAWIAGLQTMLNVAQRMERLVHRRALQPETKKTFGPVVTILLAPAGGDADN